MAIADSIVAYWKLDEASGDCADATGNGYTGTNTSVTYGAGLINNCGEFTSGTRLFDFGDTAAFYGSDRDFSWQAWVNLTSANSTGHIIGCGDISSAVRHILYYAGTPTKRFIFLVNDGSSNASVTANTFGVPSTGVWYHVVAWHDSVNNELGISVNTTSDTVAHSTGVTTTSRRTRMGRGSEGNGQLSTGSIDEVGFWDKVLSSSERSQLYNSGAGLAYPFTGGGAAASRRLLLLGVS